MDSKPVSHQIVKVEQMLSNQNIGISRELTPALSVTEYAEAEKEL